MTPASGTYSSQVHLSHPVVQLLTNSIEEDTIRVLIATDNHVGYEEGDNVRGDDSWQTFDEIMTLARTQDVCAGELPLWMFLMPANEFLSGRHGIASWRSLSRKQALEKINVQGHALSQKELSRHEAVRITISERCQRCL